MSEVWSERLSATSCVRRTAAQERPMNAPRLSIVVPVFNEQDNVAPLVREIIAALRGRSPEDGGDFEIVYVDDHSGDGTLAALRGLKAEVPELRVLRHAAQSGQRTALRRGGKAADRKSTRLNS